MAKKKEIYSEEWLEEKPSRSIESDFSDEDYIAEYPEEVVIPIKVEKAPYDDPTRMDTSTPQSVKDANEPGIIKEIITSFDPDTIVRKKVRI